MALTLPYPGLVFVPLDVLTAEEQNEIVANYTYIANQFPITNSNLDAASITPSSKNVINLGNRKIMWGEVTVENAVSGQDTLKAFNFPESFENTPKVIVSCNTWLAIRGIWSYGVDKNVFGIGVYHTQGSTLNISVNWVAFD